MPQKKQMVFIMTDTQRWDMVNCYRETGLSTPNLDALAADGIRFERAYTTQPVCGPARAGLFTGTFPAWNGSWANGMALGDNVKTIGDYAFYKCEGLLSAQIGSGIESIGSFAFCGNLNMKNLVLPQGVRYIGRQALRNCDSITSIILADTVETIEMHAFYGCDNLTIYAATSSAADGWNKYFNSSYRPIIWNCVISEDGDYIISFEKTANSIKNKNDSNVISDPVREGYEFRGWGTTSSAMSGSYTSENLTEADNGRKLYAIWAEAPSEE